MSSHNVDQLRSLVKLINENVEDYISRHEEINKDVPSVESVVSGHFDSVEKMDDKFRKNIKTVQGACAQLLATVESPGYSAVKGSQAFFESTCLRVAVDANLADILNEKPEGMHIDELAEKADINSGKLGRILRYLAMKHVFREVSPNVFANNRVSIMLRSEIPESSLVGHESDEILTSATKLSETLADPIFKDSYSVDHTPFVKAFGSSPFQYYQTEEGKARSIVSLDQFDPPPTASPDQRNQRFNKAMVGTVSITGGGNTVRDYPWSAKFPNGAKICDLGGGKGHVLLELLKAHSSLRGVVQDLPSVVDVAKQHWNKELPDAVKNSRIHFGTINFLEESPVKGCDVYYMRFVIHDWNDENSVKILSNVRASMSPNSRVLLQEFVVQPLVRGESTVHEEAPEPLLPNYGAGGIKTHFGDLIMLCALNSKERSLAEFTELGRRARLKFERTYDCGDMKLLEFSPA